MTSNEQIQNMVAEACYFVAILTFMIPLRKFNQSTLQAFGKVVNIIVQDLFAMYMLAIPASVLLAFNAGYGFYGLIAGSAIASSI